MTTRIIVNADDLGMSPTVNDAVFELMAEGRVSSATLIANAPAVRQAVSMIARFPRCSFGAHLNLTQYEPLSRGGDAHRLVDADGKMSRGIVSLRRLGPGLLRAAYSEWCAQVELLLSLGVEISHFDSHNHVHTQPQFFPVLKAVQRRYGIRRVRLSKNLYSADQPCSRSVWWQKRAYNIALRAVYRTRTTARFTELMTFERVSQAPNSVPTGDVEVMVHPGAPYAGAETELLRSEWMAETMRSAPLISYREL